MFCFLLFLKQTQTKTTNPNTLDCRIQDLDLSSGLALPLDVICETTTECLRLRSRGTCLKPTHLDLNIMAWSHLYLSCYFYCPQTSNQLLFVSFTHSPLIFGMPCYKGWGQFLYQICDWEKVMLCNYLNSENRGSSHFSMWSSVQKTVFSGCWATRKPHPDLLEETFLHIIRHRRLCMPFLPHPFVEQCSQSPVVWLPQPTLDYKPQRTQW